MIYLYNLGNFPNLQIEVDGESGGSVTEEIPGQPDNDLVSLMIGNRPSTPFRLSELQLIMVCHVKIALHYKHTI